MTPLYRLEPFGSGNGGPGDIGPLRDRKGRENERRGRGMEGERKG